MILALSLAQDTAILRSQYSGGQTNCVVPSPQPLVTVEAQNDEADTDVDPSINQFMEHSIGSRGHIL